MNKQKHIILGAGGHGQLLASLLLSQNITPSYFVDPGIASSVEKIFGIPVLRSDEIVFREKTNEVSLVNGIASLKSTALRSNLFKKFKERGYRFAKVVHSSAVIFPEVRLGEGTQILAGCIVQTNSQLEENTLINTGSIVGHDCRIGAGSHICPGVILSGGVAIGAEVHVGTGAVVLQNLNIGDGCLIGAMSLINKDMPNRATSVAQPARFIF